MKAILTFQAINSENKLLIIDEIGKMELFSKQFKRYLEVLFGQQSRGSCILLATIPNKRSDPFIESVRNQSNTRIWTVSVYFIIFFYNNSVNIIIKYDILYHNIIFAL